MKKIEVKVIGLPMSGKSAIIALIAKALAEHKVHTTIHSPDVDNRILLERMRDLDNIFKCQEFDVSITEEMEFRKWPVYFLYSSGGWFSVIAKGEKVKRKQYLTYMYQDRAVTHGSMADLNFYEEGSLFEQHLTPFYAPPSEEVLSKLNMEIVGIRRFAKHDTFWETKGTLTTNSIGPSIGSRMECDEEFEGLRYILRSLEE